MSVAHQVLPQEGLGQAYEQFLQETRPLLRKAAGVYYTPAPIVAHVVRHTLGALLAGLAPVQAAKLKVLDPACGCGSFLLGVYRYLLDWHRDWYVSAGPSKHRKELCRGPDGSWRLTPTARKRILLGQIHGVDIDPQAVAVAQVALAAMMREEDFRSLGDFGSLLGGNIKCGNALLSPDFPDHRVRAFDWDAEFLGIMSAGGFDVVVGNPPWGQKEIDSDPAVKDYIRARYPSAAGIYDIFRPFVELGVRLTRRQGRFGMVLPDIVLLKDYPQTRRFLLDRLALTRIDWWGQAFASAVIDVTSIIGEKCSPPPGQQTAVAIHDPGSPLEHDIPQTVFLAQPRHVFNLHLTAAKRRVLERLADCRKLGEDFEVHEGVHSGNIRAELFVSEPLDESCRPLIFGRDEILPYRLRWGGRYVRLSAFPAERSRKRYANLGRLEWHEREKVLVRRTGDFVLAAVDRERRHASNNVFLVFSRGATAMNLDGLCALLNSRFMTWYFRTIEPRQGRVFAELKIKHLTTFPLPGSGSMELNRLGARRGALAKQHAEAGRGLAGCRRLDGQIDRLVRELFDLGDDWPEELE